MAVDRDAGVVLDCDTGRRMGCATYCCRLIVRLRPGERDPSDPREEKSCVDKDPKSGLCIHLDDETHRCGIWAERPSACREFDCNADYRLQVVLEQRITSIVQLFLAEPETGPPKRVPYVRREPPNR